METHRERQRKQKQREIWREIDGYTHRVRDRETHKKTVVDKKTQRCRERHKVVNDSEMICMSTLRVSNSCAFGTLIKSVSLMGLFGLQYLRWLIIQTKLESWLVPDTGASLWKIWKCPGTIISRGKCSLSVCLWRKSNTVTGIKKLIIPQGWGRRVELI